MTKLELKRLAPYLPYGLKLNTLENEMYLIDFKNKKVESTFRGHLINIYEWDEVKPILRPLSDLIPLEHDEVNDFVLIKIVDGTDQHCDAYDEWRDAYFDNPEPSQILQAPYEVFEELLRQHYDVFGLIEAGLAININELNQK